MERLKVFDEIRRMLADLRTLGISLKENFSSLTESLNEERFLDFERLNATRNDLNRLIAEESSCLSLCDEVLEEAPPETFTQLEGILNAAEIKILETSIYGRSKKFLQLTTDNPEYQRELTRHQKKLQALFAKKNFNETAAEPYARFIDAMKASSTGAKVAAISELVKDFDNDFIGAGLFDGDLILKSDDTPADNELPEKIPDEPEESEFIKIFREKGALLTDEDFAPWENFSLDRNERDKEFSAKRFKSDFKTTSLLQKIISIVAIRGCVSSVMAPSKFFTAETFETAAQSLLKKGYLQKFSFGNLGSFYGMTKKLYDFVRSDNGKKFINSITAGYKNSSSSFVFLDEDVKSTLPRAIYFHICNYAPESEKYSITAEFFSQAFRAKFCRTDERGLLLGCFWDDVYECDKFLKKLQQNLSESGRSPDCIVIAGLTAQHAEKVFDALKTAYEDYFAKTIADIYFYSAADDALYTEDAPEKITLEEFFAPVDDEFVDDEPINDEPVNDEPVDDESIGDGPIETEDSNEILSAVRQMIVDKKFYCATAYLKAQSLQNAAFEPLYRRIAFASDDPLLDAAYSSNEIFTLFDANLTAFDEALITAAALRAFFYNRTESDYGVDDLYDSIKDFKLLRSNNGLAQVIREVADFKINNQKGAEYFSKYQVNDTQAIKEKFIVIVREAEDYFNRVFEGESHGDKLTLAKTKKLLFAPDGEFCKIFSKVKTPADSIEAETLNAVKNFLTENFLRHNGKTDKDKLQDWIEDCWNRAKDPSRSDSIAGNWRSNLVNNLERAAEIMSDWVACAEKLSDSKANPHEKFFAQLLGNIGAVRNEIDAELKGNTLNTAGFLVLDNTLNEIAERITGTFNPCEHDYFYAEFLCGDEVILDEDCLPKFDLNISDGTDKLLPEQIERHAAQKNLPDFRERIEFIVKRKGDNFGAAKILDAYIQKTEGKSFIEEQGYHFEETVTATGFDAERDLKIFTGGVEFAQIHGQLQSMPEDTKKKILHIVNNCYDYAVESKNYGVFSRVKDFWESEIKRNAAALAESLSFDLTRAVEKYKQSVGNFDAEELSDSIIEIEKLISLGLLTKARECIRELSEGKLYKKPFDAADDTLSRFIEVHDDYQRRVQNISTSMKNLLERTLQERNKFGKAKADLLESWLPNGMPDTDSSREKIQERVKSLLEALGFDVDSVILIGSSDAKSLTYEVKLKKSFQIRHNHPIAEFGSGAEADKVGFRVTCLFGQFPKENLIDRFKRLDQSNTLVLLDDALKLDERRWLAKAIKSEKSLMNVFAVVDRVVIMYLLKHCSEQINTKRINDTLMALIMPFSRCRPYIWEPNKLLPPEMFIGRETEMNEVKSPNGVNIVYGGRQLGKSALLKMARREIDGNNNQRAILVDIRNQNFEEAALSVSRELTARKFFDEPVNTNNWDELAHKIQSRLLNDTPTKIPYFLLMLDEADKFIETCAEIEHAPISALSRIQQEDYNGGRFKFVIAGLRNIVRYDKEQAQKNNGILPILKSLTIKPFGFEEARKLLEVPLRYLGVHFPNNKFIYTIEETALYFPGLIQYFCDKLLLTLFDGTDYGANTPIYELKETHINKILSDKDFLDTVKDRIEITLRLGDDNYYYVIAQLLAYLCHKTPNVDEYSPKEILTLAETDDFKDLLKENFLPDDEKKIDALMLELCELNILRKTKSDKYQFSGKSIYRYMGSEQQIEDELLNLMEEAGNG